MSIINLGFQCVGLMRKPMSDEQEADCSAVSKCNIMKQLRKAAETPYELASLPSHPLLQEFLSHCCQARHYSFCVKKCGSTDCSI